MEQRISIDRITEAYQVIDSVFKDSPQYVCGPISEQLGLEMVLKVECLNPIRSFKGRGTEFLFHRLGSHKHGYVCASAGNFGQGMAYSARKRGILITVFAATNANPLKIERMRALGAEVVLEGADFDGAKDAARRRADDTGAMFIERSHRSQKAQAPSHSSWAGWRNRSTPCSFLWATAHWSPAWDSGSSASHLPHA